MEHDSFAFVHLDVLHVEALPIRRWAVDLQGLREAEWAFYSYLSEEDRRMYPEVNSDGDFVFF